ncbi:hypothetical protein HWC53_gp199 [Bacillus phage vB_BmeM-Goe8]|uniref:Uncharacterized protein n=1 Tax=Bacillus phage vB_BmeM-Goe8 TaxID=2593638 RepID=A0A516KMT3_9CAUD|nr:hypothetical protein HWC53_gp199 [Bacillus phage vB_BmeM-Goe8]QDP42890.1 hypothetical protein Goe8_c01170 [Bacillus phage vB_BmeM-Goe8]
MKKHFTQEPIKAEHLYDFLECVLNKQIKDEATAKRVKRLAKYTVTLQDVAVVVEAMMRQHQAMQEKVIDNQQVIQGVLMKLGATPEMFQEAEVEYNQQLEEFKKQFEAAKEELAKGKEGETQSVVDKITEEIAQNEVEIPDTEGK